MGYRKLTPEQAKRRAQVVQMRRARLSFAYIGQQLGITPQRAGQVYRLALMDIPKANVDEHRIEELEFYDLAVNKLLTIANSTELTSRTRVEAWNAIRGWAERKSKLLGLDAPAKHEVLTIDSIEAEIRRLQLELGTNDTSATYVAT